MERLTHRAGKYITEYCDKDHCKYCDKDGNCTAFDPTGTYIITPKGNEVSRVCLDAFLERLAELEDKLESGQALELPCKLHDTLYTHKKVFGKWQIEELECWGYHCDGRNILFIDCQNARTASSNSLRSFRVEDFGKRVFTNKNQAEARLKELQG